MDPKPVPGNIDNVFIWNKEKEKDKSGNVPVIITKDNNKKNSIN
jgi:hypothetical protein